MLAPATFRSSIAGAVAATIGLLAAYANAGPGSEPVSEYRRVLVPAEQPESWPRGGKSLLPIEAREFDEWVFKANEPASTATIVEAEYHAKLEGNRLIDSRGWWNVELQGRRAAQLMLDSSTIAIANATWRGPEASPARLGWQAVDGKSLQLALDVSSTGSLDFEWRVVGQSPAYEAPAFTLNFPSATRTRLVLELPAFKRPVVEDSVVLEAPERPARTGRWVLALGPQQEHLLRIEDTRRRETSLSAATYRQTCRYDVRRTGIDLTAALELSTSGKLPKAISVRLPPGMQLVAVEGSGTTLEWHVLARRDGPANLVSIDLPAGASAGNDTILLRAWGPFTPDSPQQLPLVAADNLFWTAGTIDVQIDDALTPIQMSSADCLQVDAEVRDSAVHRRQKMSFAADSPDAAVEVTVGHRLYGGEVHNGVSLELGGAEIAGRVVSRVAIERGNAHQLAADLDGAWSVEAVESLPADVLGEWYVDKSVKPTVLRLQLQRAIAAGETVEFVTTVRSPTAATESIPVADLNPLDWRQLKPAERMLQLRPAEFYDLEIDGRWNELSADRLPGGEPALLTPAADARSAVVGDDDEATIRLLPKKVAYDATVEVDSLLAGERIDLTYRLTCTPRGGGFDHVMLFFAQPTGERLQWVDVDSSRPLNVEKMPDTDPRFGGLPKGGELWRLELGRLYARPITIETTRSIVWRGRSQIPLVSLPDAATQQGRAEVASHRNAAPLLIARNMSPAPLPLESNAATEVCAVYRFQPTRFYDSAAVPELGVEPAAVADTARPITTRIDVESRYGVDGAGVHRASMRMSTGGATELTLRFPEGFTIAGSRVGEQSIPSAKSNQITIPLASDSTNALVEVELTSRGQPLANGNQLEPPLPVDKYSMLAGEWKVGLPVGFAAAESSSETEPRCLERLFGVFARRESRPFNPLDPGDWNSVWAHTVSLFSSPAEAATANASVDGDRVPAGMEVYRFSFGTTALPLVTVLHSQATAAAALAAFIFCAVGAQLARCRLRTRIWLAIVTAAASLVLTATWAPLASAATLGIIASALWSWIQPRIERPTVAAVVALAVGCSVSAHAAPPSPTIEQVLVPVDKDGNQVGTKYFVSTEFLRQLISQADDSAAHPALVVGMHCDGQLMQEAGNAGVVAGEWQLTFDVATSTRDSRLTLPLKKDEADWPVTASLDGIPVPIQWEKDGSSCTIQIEEPGRGRISIAFAPHVQEVGSDRSFILTVPPIVGTQVHVVGPSGLKGLRGENLAFDENQSADQTTWDGEVDSSGRLTCVWPVEIERNSRDVNRQIGQLQWLRLDRAGSEMDLILVQRGEEEWPETISLAVDADWRWRPGQAFESQASPEPLADSRQLIVVSIPPEARRQPQLSFGFESTSGLPFGRVRPPAVEATSLRATERWLAVSCAPSLECKPSNSSAGAGQLPARLAAALNPGDSDTSSLAVDLDRVEAGWYLNVRPAEVKSSSRGQLSLAAGRDRVSVNYLVDVSPQGAERFGWSLRVPADLSIDDVFVSQGDEQQVIEWARAGADRVNVFFSRPVDNAYRLELRGSLPIPADGLLPLPKLGPLGAANESQTVALYREDDVFAEWRFAGDPPWVESGPSPTLPFDVQAHFVRAFSIDSVAAGGVQIAVERARPELSGATSTRVVRAGNRWEATWSCDLQVEKGAIDTMLIRAPATWSGPFEISPTATLQAAGLPAANGNTPLLLRLPRQAVAGELVRLVVRSPLSAEDGQSLSAPRIELLAAGQRKEYLSLPQSLDGEPISWTRSGIEPAELPADFAAKGADSGDEAHYRILNDTVNVALRPRPARAEQASVRLAETTTLLGAGGSELEVTRYLVSPAGLDRCNLAIPPGRLLVRTNLNGRPALVRPIDAQHFEVQFRHPTLPQVLDVVTRTVSNEAKTQDRIELARPVLETSGRVIPIDLTLWTIGGEIGGRQPRAENGAAISQAKLAELRRDWMTSMSQRASSAVLEAPTIDGYSWFVRWAAQLTEAVRRAEQAGKSLAVASPATRVAQPEGNASEDAAAQPFAWVEQIAEFFNVTPEAVAEDEGTMVDTIDPGQLASISAGDLACFVSDGGRSPLVVDLAPAAWTAERTRYALLASLGALALVTVWLTRTTERLERVKNWPEAWGLLLGLAGWIWLSPSLVGLAVAVASAVLLVRRWQRERKSPRHDSSKLPNSIPEELA
ncbi:MAG: hypothetical protein AB7I57_14975 [Pirellulales bacterium]